jgi:hypothetical protein
MNTPDQRNKEQTSPSKENSKDQNGNNSDKSDNDEDAGKSPDHHLDFDDSKAAQVLAGMKKKHTIVLGGNEV